MPRPRRREIEVPLLLEINKLGGEAPWKNLIKLVAAHFPQMTQAEITEPGPKNYTKWEYEIRWTSWNLKDKGELERGKGTWRITEKGRKRLKGEETPPALPPPPTPPKRHDELKQKMIYVGKKLGYHVSAEEGALYRHDVLWKQGAYKSPCHVIEICEGGSLPKDFDALHWANDPKNWGAKGILIVTDDKDFEKAVRRFVGQAGLTAVKAETVDALCKIVDENPQFLELIFSKES